MVRRQTARSVIHIHRVEHRGVLLRLDDGLADAHGFVQIIVDDQVIVVLHALHFPPCRLQAVLDAFFILTFKVFSLYLIGAFISQIVPSIKMSGLFIFGIFIVLCLIGVVLSMQRRKIS